MKIQYRLCPKCFRTVPVQSGEMYCANDGTRLLGRCVRCDHLITSPFTRFCVSCGLDFSKLAAQEPAAEEATLEKPNTRHHKF